jgi:type IV pilus assembly protein PilE
MSNHNSSRTHRLAGFTLIELMIAVVIATVLISIAIPAYNASIRKSRRTDAKTAVLDLAGREERFYNTNNTYSAVPSDLGYNGTAVAFPMVVGNGYYSVSVTVVPAAGLVGPSYTIQAVPVTADQLLDTNCLLFQVTNTGAQTATNANCWQ